MTTFSTNAGASSAVGPTSGGKTYAYNNISTAPTVVLQPNPNRVSATFHNPGATGIWFGPSQVQGYNTAPTTPSNVALTPSPSALGGCFYVYPNGGQITIVGECSGAYQAFASSGTTNPLTVTESNT